MLTNICLFCRFLDSQWVDNNAEPIDVNPEDGWTIPDGIEKQTLVIDLQTGVFSLVAPNEEAPALFKSPAVSVTTQGPTNPTTSTGDCPEGTTSTGEVCVE